jgi:hypothetical protein
MARRVTAQPGDGGTIVIRVGQQAVAVTASEAVTLADRLARCLNPPER